ncbi:MAG TPA: isocitrate lyase/phosphoenolpyruvate mutase family protein [Streptosporangiaceae bacterium]|nr:isocitrate lyase/phosphoenolpyruvate mutase family protein [Streptosporangiaceae bacterium]
MRDAVRLRSLHVPGQPLLLANVWDPPSAVVVAASGPPVVATTSAAVAASLGHADNGEMPPDVAFAAIARIAAAVDVPVTAEPTNLRTVVVGRLVAL